MASCLCNMWALRVHQAVISEDVVSFQRVSFSEDTISISTLFGHSGLTTSQFPPSGLYLFGRPFLMAPIRTDSPRRSQHNPKSRPASLQIPSAPSPANDDIKVESGYLMQKMSRIVDLFEEETKWSRTVCKALGFIV